MDRLLLAGTKRGAAFAAARGASYVGQRTGGFVPLASWKRGRGIKGETKAVDTGTVTYGCSNGGAYNCINLIRTGSTFTNRIGRKIAMQNVKIEGKFLTADEVQASYIRLVLVYDAQSNGSAITWSDVFKNYDQATAATSDVFSGVNLDNRDRFRIVMDKRYCLQSTDSGGKSDGDPQPTSCEYYINEWIKLNNVETQYKADSSPAVIGDIATGALWFMIYSDASNMGTFYQFTGNIRLRFTDN